MKKTVVVFLLCMFSFCLAGCVTTKNGNPDPVQSVQSWDNWIKENMW